MHEYFKMTSEGEFASTYAEINNVSSEGFEIVINKCYSSASNTSSKGKSNVSGEAFEMDVNKCYSNVRSTSSKRKSDGKESSSNRVGYFIAGSVLLLVIILVALSACVIYALVEISKLKSDDDLAALQEQLSMFQQNVSEADVIFLNHELSQLRQNLSEVKQQLLIPELVSSCSDIPPSFPSGYYWVVASTGSVVRVYCDMTLSCGNITGGWMRVTELNMTDTSQQCPSNLVERSDNNIRRCETMDAGCSPTTYSTLHMNYNKVCGRITGYQVGTTNAFLQDNPTIDSAYVDGVSLTHGSPRQHIWTFAAALDRNDDNAIGGQRSRCPCRFEENPFDPPSFVGEDYFCDAGNEEFMTGETGLQTDPLWDGTDCLCCNNPPWLYKHLPQPTTEDIEMRVCRNADSTNENIGIQEIEIYVQ